MQCHEKINLKKQLSSEIMTTLIFKIAGYILYHIFLVFIYKDIILFFIFHTDIHFTSLAFHPG